MASYQPVQFTSPGYDYGADISQIERRRAMAQMLQQQGLTPVQQQPVAPGQFAVPTSPWQDAAKLAQTYAGIRQQNKADTQQRELATKAQRDMANILQSAQSAMAGTPMTEDASGNVTPAVAGDASKAAAIYMRDPRTAQLGMQMMQQEMQRKMLAEALRPKPQQPTGNVPAYGSPNFQPSSPQATGGVAGGMPMEAWLAVDPTGQKYIEQLAKDRAPINVRPGGTVYVPGQGPQFTAPQGGMATQWGPNGPQAAMVPGYAGAQTELHSIPNPSAPMVNLKTSSGQDIQLSQPEYLSWQKTGELPLRYGGKPSQQAAPSLPPTTAPQGGGFRVPGAPGLGVVGAGQTQQDIIQQARQQAGGKALDEAFAKDYATFVQGGSQDSAKQLSQLKDVIGELRKPGANLTGPTLGNVPDVAKNFINPKSVAMRERVEEVVQRSLRAILGAQFTEREGERLIARAYNPRLSESENAVRVERLFTQLNQAFEQKKSAAQYFERNGTLEGFRGKLPNIADFDPDAGGGGGAANDPLGIRGK